MPRIRLFRRVNLLTALLLGVGGMMLGVLLTVAALRGRHTFPSAATASPEAISEKRLPVTAGKGSPPSVLPALSSDAVNSVSFATAAPPTASRSNPSRSRKEMRERGKQRKERDDKDDKKGRRHSRKGDDDDD